VKNLNSHIDSYCFLDLPLIKLGGNTALFSSFVWIVLRPRTELEKGGGLKFEFLADFCIVRQL